MAESKRNQRYFIEGKGEVSEEKSGRFEQYMDGYLSGMEDDEGIVEKTAEEKEMFEWLLETVGYIASTYGAKPYSFKPEHIHILTDEAMAEYEDRYRSRQKENEADSRKESLRFDRFYGLNEGITQELTKLFYKKVIRNSDRFKSAVEKYDQENPTGDQETFYYPEVVVKPYGWLVVLFEDICEKIKNSQSDKFADVAGVRHKFFKIYFSGDVKEMKPLLDVLGSSAFDDLSDINAEADDAELKKVINFRQKYGLPDDKALNKMVEKKQQKQSGGKQERINAIMSAGAFGVLGGEEYFRGNILETAVTLSHECFHLFGVNKFNFAGPDSEESWKSWHRSGLRVKHGSK